MYYTVIKHDGNLRTREKFVENTAFYTLYFIFNQSERAQLSVYILIFNGK